MDQPIVRIVLFPRFSALAGEGPFLLAPTWVRPYERAIIAMWRGRGLGADDGAAVVLAVQQSTDLTIWTDLGTVEPTAGEELATEFLLTADWMRVSGTVSGEDPGVTCWAVADLVPRHS